MEAAAKDTAEQSKDAASTKRADTSGASGSSDLSDRTTATSPRDDHPISNEEAKFTTMD